ncbi:neuropeptides capa receptor-like [Paramacrobiotus metropolitanus]|uniref:neuropeptides capa receptor-like n=1 Tax=Paramacrobiotus metropolitanus TaxID=2943436 RepID=UPI002445A03D|nr:neuropeptides capa receptor-like [Paramacrobiotus metropolitanus]
MAIELLVNQTATTAVFDVDVYIRQHLGDRVIPHAHFFTGVYGTLFVLGVVGNFINICLLIVWNRHRHWNGIDPYLLNLALTDLLQTLVSLPLEIYKYWNQYPWSLGPAFCSAVALLAEAALCSSILTIIAFTVERYIAVAYPMKALQMQRSRPFKIILACWIIALITAIPFAYFHNVNYLQTPDGASIPEASWCAIHFNLHEQLAPLFIVSTITFYAVPMIVLLVLHRRIWLVVRGRTLDGGSGDEERSDGSAEAEESFRRSGRLSKQRSSASSRIHEHCHHYSQRVFYGLLAIVVSFFLCYGLFHAQRLMFALVDWSDQQQLRQMVRINDILFPVSGFLYHANPALDSVFYSLMSDKCRQMCARLLRWANKSKDTCAHARSGVHHHPLTRDGTVLYHCGPPQPV